MSKVRIFGLVLSGLMAVSMPAMAQVDVMKPQILGFCDPLMSEPVNIELGDDDDDEGEQLIIHMFDREVARVLSTEDEVMEALYEEKWDLATGTPIERFELCNQEPSYIVHWTQVIELEENDNPIIRAEGLMSFGKDGTFTYVYDNRPYRGDWRFENGEMHMTAAWLDDGEPLVAPVERVVTPVRIVDGDGDLQAEYEEVVYRVGMFRNLRLPTTVKGQIIECAC